MESLTRGRLLIAELCFRLISRVVLFLKNTVITGLEPPQNKHETPFLAVTGESVSEAAWVFLIPYLNMVIHRYVAINIHRIQEYEIYNIYQNMYKGNCDEINAPWSNQSTRGRRIALAICSVICGHRSNRICDWVR